MQFILPIPKGCHTISLVTNVPDFGDFVGQLYCIQTPPYQSVRKYSPISLLFTKLTLGFQNSGQRCLVVTLSLLTSSWYSTDALKITSRMSHAHFVSLSIMANSTWCSPPSQRFFTFICLREYCDWVCLFLNRFFGPQWRKPIMPVWHIRMDCLQQALSHLVPLIIHAMISIPLAFHTSWHQQRIFCIFFHRHTTSPSTVWPTKICSSFILIWTSHLWRKTLSSSLLESNSEDFLISPIQTTVAINWYRLWLFFQFYGDLTCLFHIQISITIHSVTNQYGELPLLPNDGFDGYPEEIRQFSPKSYVPHIALSSIPKFELPPCDRY